MKKLIMFLSVLGMVSVGSVFAQAEGQTESEKCAPVHSDDRNAQTTKGETTKTPINNDKGSGDAQ